MQLVNWLSKQGTGHGNFNLHINIVSIKVFQKTNLGKLMQSEN